MQKQELSGTDMMVPLNGNHNEFGLATRPPSITSPPNTSEDGGRGRQPAVTVANDLYGGVAVAAEAITRLQGASDGHNSQRAE